MIAVGTIIKSQTENSGTIFYNIVSAGDNSFNIISLCKIRKGFLTTKYKSSLETQILKSEVGINYLEATKREVNRIKEILSEPADSISQAG